MTHDSQLSKDDLRLDPALLDAWPAPGPRPGLTDAVLSHCASASSATAALPDLDPLTDDSQGTPLMQPTPLQHPSRRSMMLPVALGFAAAAAILLAFYLGRGSAPVAVPSTVAPTVELHVAAPPSVPTPPAPANAPPAPRGSGFVVTAFADGRFEVGGETIGRPKLAAALRAANDKHKALTLFVDEGLDHERVIELLDLATEIGFERLALESLTTGSAPAEEPEAAASSPEGTRKSHRKRRGPGHTSPDLKNPFDDDPLDPTTFKKSAPTKNPFAKRDSTRDSSRAGLENPFTSKRGSVRVGTVPGAPPARVTIDGKDRGKTPLARIDLSPGKHTVTFVWEDGHTTTKTVTVESGKSLVVRGDPEA